MANVNIWYNSETGYVATDEGFNKWFNEHTGVDKLNAKFFGWHGPFKTKDEAFKYYDDNKSAHPDWKAPNNNAYTAATGVATDALGITGGQIDAQNWFIRIGEILLGLVLIAVGAAKLTGTTNVISRALKVA